MTQQYVWGQEYIDQLLMIRRQNGTWFAHQDANWNVIALTTPNGDVAEEVQYQPYGLPQVKRHIAFGDSDADGDVDSTDNTAHTAALTTYNRLFDADLDGDVSSTSGDADKTAWDASYNEPAANVTMVVPNRGFSPSGNPFLFTGRRLDAETGLYFYRFRTYHPTLKVFLQRDPLGYGASGPSMYQYVGGMPTAAGDPLGLDRYIILISKDAPWFSRWLANRVAASLRAQGHSVHILIIHAYVGFENAWGSNDVDHIIFMGHGDKENPTILLGRKKKHKKWLDPSRLIMMKRGDNLKTFIIYACYQGKWLYEWWRAAGFINICGWAGPTLPLLDLGSAENFPYIGSIFSLPVSSPPEYESECTDGSLDP